MTQWRPKRGLFLLIVLLFWFNTGLEEFRLGHLGDIPQHPYKLFIPPWKPLRAYVSQGGDEKLYWEYTELALGQAPDLDFLARSRRGDFEKVRATIAGQIRSGAEIRLPYRDFPFEYPPLAFLLMMIPRIFVDSLAAYRIAFGIVAALITFAACAIGVKIRKKLDHRTLRDPWLPIAVFILAIGPLLASRTDSLPAFFVVAALFFMSRKRSFVAGLCAGAGILCKLYPLLLLLLWTAMLGAKGKKREATLLVIGATLMTALIGLPFFWVAPAAFVKSTLLYGARPFEAGSIPGAWIILMNGVSSVVGSFGSYNVLSPDWLGAIWSILLPTSVLVCVGLAYQQSLGYQIQDQIQNQAQDVWVEKLIDWTIALLCLILVTSKILSPQYLIWLVPLAAITSSITVRRWAIAAAALTQLFYPFLFAFFVEGDSKLAALLVVTRNLVLLGLAYHALRAARSTEQLQ